MRTKIIFLSLIICVLGIAIYSSTKKNPKLQLPFTKITPTATKELELTQQQTFIIMGDTGSGAQQQKDVAQAIQNHCSNLNCKAAIIAGDVIYENGVTSATDIQFKTKFADIYKNIDLPFYIAFGNHDYLGCTQCYLDYAKTSTKWKMPNSYYKQSFDNIDFFIIDTEQFNKTQQDWLTKEISKSNAKWKAVVGHRPILTYEELHANDDWNGQEQLKNIMCNKVNFYLAGHSHLIEEVGKIDNCAFKQLVAGSGGSYPRQLLPDHPEEEFEYEGNGFLALSVNKEKITYTFIDKNSQILKTETLQ